MKFLILSVTAGQGHHQCAKAISDSLFSKGHECEILDVYKYAFPPLGKTIDKGYILSTKYIPDIYGKFYKLADEHDLGSTITSEMQRLLYKKVVDYIESFSPDAIICTHVYPSILITKAIKREKLNSVPTIGIITDFTVHPFWQNTELDAYIIPNELLGYQCFEKNIPAEKIYPFGIPISERFSKKISKQEAKKILNIPDIDTILIMSGSMGFGNIPKLIKRIDSLSHNFQMLCICGNNKKIYEEISSFAYSHEVFSYGFVDNIDIMMDASDFIITKPGGLSVSESLAKNLPMILVNPIPGQETRNLEFLLNSGLAMAVSETFPIEEAVYQLYKSRNRFEGQNSLTTLHQKTNSALDTALLAIKMANDFKSSKKG